MLAGCEEDQAPAPKALTQADLDQFVEEALLDEAPVLRKATPAQVRAMASGKAVSQESDEAVENLVDEVPLDDDATEPGLSDDEIDALVEDLLMEEER